MFENVVRAEEFLCDRAKTCCFTGHRKKALPDGGSDFARSTDVIKSLLAYKCEEAYGEGYRTFITGMAEGIDLFCAEIVNKMKNNRNYPGIELVCALPYAEQIRELGDADDRYLYSMITEQACSRLVIISQKWDKERYRKRNSFMVEHSSLLIGAYYPENYASGTRQTVNLARKSGLRLDLIDLSGSGSYWEETD
ncbi:MAG: DUF1273 family protein [Ruminococcus sp.]|nr:DUF1273 family protein [Ruminococcus sp.]